MAAKKVILVIGYIDMDFYMTTPRLPDEGESLEALSYSFSPGGKGANAAVAAFRSSHVRRPGADDTSPEFDSAFTEIDIDVSMIGAVGDDANGDLAKKNLVQNGVDISKVRTFDGLNTGICFCMIESGTGENRLLFTTGATRQLGSADFETVEQLCTSDGRRPDLIISQLEVQVRAVEQMLQTAHEASIDVVLNAAPASQIDLDAYEWITHLIVNETEAAILAGRPVKMVNSETWYDIAEEFLKDGVKNVVITLAAQGAYYANQKGHGLVPAKSVTVADATGAGDTFVGAYATEYLRQKSTQEWKSATDWDIEKAIRRANGASAFTIGKVGAQASMPWADNIDSSYLDSTIHTYSRLSTDA